MPNLIASRQKRIATRTKTSRRVASTMPGISRRNFLAALGASTLGGCGLTLSGGLFNPCPQGPLPEALANHDVVLSALEGLEGALIRDTHVHLAGQGDGATGAWVNPAMHSLWNPAQYIRRKFYLNAACIDNDAAVDAAYVQRLLRLTRDLPQGMKLMLLAFDYRYAEDGSRDQARSAFYVPNRWAAKLARQYPDQFEWIASIHPYRADAVDALDAAVRDGAQCVKWLPAAQNIDPGSVRCDPFYRRMAHHGLPLLCHVDEEQAVAIDNQATLGNPLRLRRALDQGVRVIVAHCAGAGHSIDLDRGRHAARVANFDLFARLLDEPRYAGQIFGDISAVSQVNRSGPVLKQLIEREDWHERLVYGSDYPLPAVIPMYSMQQLVALGVLDASKAEFLEALRRHNPLLFDLVHKRHLRSGGRRFADAVFHSAGHFGRTLRLN